MSTRRASMSVGRVFIAALTTRFSKWQMHPKSRRFGCFSFRYFTTPFLWPFIVLQVSLLKASMFAYYIPLASRHSSTLSKMALAVPLLAVGSSINLVTAFMALGSKNLTSTTRSLASTLRSLDSSMSNVEHRLMIVTS